MEFLTNPWVIIVVVLSVVIGNIAALKYTANMKFGQMDKKRKIDAQSDDENKSEDPEQKTK